MEAGGFARPGKRDIGPCHERQGRHRLDFIDEPGVERAQSTGESGPIQDPVISVHGLKMSYGSFEAVRGIDLEVRPGKF